MKKNSLLIAVLVAIVVGVAAFFGGMQYQKMQKGSNTSNFGSQRRQGGTNGSNVPVRGEVIASDDKSITVKMQDGSTKIVLLSGNTSITEATSASKDAVTKGKQVLVIGQTNSDGSVTAGNVQLNPQFRGQGNSRGN